jgi:hypothetical protein
VAKEVCEFLGNSHKRVRITRWRRREVVVPIALVSNPS